MNAENLAMAAVLSFLLCMLTVSRNCTARAATIMFASAGAYAEIFKVVTSRSIIDTFLSFGFCIKSATFDQSTALCNAKSFTDLCQFLRKLCSI
jgi:hypothetical protein